METKTLIRESETYVEDGVSLVNRAGQALESIVGRVHDISKLVSGIAQGAAEQASGLGEINSGVGQLDEVTQQNAAMAQHSASTSHVLNGDAARLEDLVNQFQLSRAALGHQSSRAAYRVWWISGRSAVQFAACSDFARSANAEKWSSSLSGNSALSGSGGSAAVLGSSRRRGGDEGTRTTSAPACGPSRA